MLNRSERVIWLFVVTCSVIFSVCAAAKTKDGKHVRKLKCSIDKQKEEYTCEFENLIFLNSMHAVTCNTYRFFYLLRINKKNPEFFLPQLKSTMAMITYQYIPYFVHLLTTFLVKIHWWNIWQNCLWKKTGDQLHIKILRWLSGKWLSSLVVWNNPLFNYTYFLLYEKKVTYVKWHNRIKSAWKWMQVYWTTLLLILKSKWSMLCVVPLMKIYEDYSKIIKKFNWTNDLISHFRYWQ